MATDTLCSHKYASHDINSRLFPIVCTVNGLAGKKLRSNIKGEFLDRCHVRSDVTEVERAVIFGRYVYAVANAPSYRSRYLEEISQDFPRIPISKNPDIVSALAELGIELEQAHCLHVNVPEGEFPFHGSMGQNMCTPKWKNGVLWIGESSFFEGVDNDIWKFQMAGYQVCKSWFSAGNRVGLQRKGMPITDAVIKQFRRVLWAVKKTLKVRKMIDSVIEEHGGWPEAFQDKSGEAVTKENGQQRTSPETRQLQPTSKEKYPSGQQQELFLKNSTFQLEKTESNSSEKITETERQNLKRRANEVLKNRREVFFTVDERKTIRDTLGPNSINLSDPRLAEAFLHGFN